MATKVLSGLLDFLPPLKGDYPITLKPGDQIPSQFGGGIMHDVDFGAPEGTPVYASESGVVNFAGTNYGGGNGVRIDHVGGVETAYFHLKNFVVSEGQQVKRGQVIGYVGNTGAYSTGPHLLFGVKKNGTSQNPLDLFDLDKVFGDSDYLGGLNSPAPPSKDDLFENLNLGILNILNPLWWLRIGALGAGTALAFFGYIAMWRST